MTDSNDKSDRFDVLRQLNEISRSNISYLTGTLPPFAAALAKWNLEMLRFSAQRALEYRELSARMTQCRTPVEVWTEQKRFFEHMQGEYAEEMGRLLDLMNGISQVKPEEGEASAPRGTGAPTSQSSSPPGSDSVLADKPVPFARAVVEQTTQMMDQASESAKEMAGAAAAAAEQVAQDARSAMEDVDENSPGAPQAQAAIDAAEAAAKTIARQAEATAALVAGSAAVWGTMSVAESLSDNDNQGEGDDYEDDSDDADMAASVIAEPSPSEASDDDEGEVSAGDDEIQTAEAMLSEPSPEQDDDAAETPSDDDADDSDAGLHDARPPEDRN